MMANAKDLKNAPDSSSSGTKRVEAVACKNSCVFDAVNGIQIGCPEEQLLNL